MANSQATATSFKVELLCGIHALGTTVVRAGTTKDTLKAALYLTSASLGAATTAYSSSGELAATGNYTAGGVTVTNATEPTSSGTTAYWTPSAAFSWSNLTSSGAFDAVLLYNSTQGNKAIAVYTIGTQQVTAGTLTISMPSNTDSTALLRLP